ncbi:MAG: ferredoxin reductase family protein [Anderseniella sp.]|nr:ferredoxin reductase family protein [Anderseniella sp.]
MSPVILFPFYLAVTFAPLMLAWLQGLPVRPVQDELATGLGMVAFSILLSEFVLSGRFKIISARMGMDVIMRVHQLAARAALLFVLVHPFLYATPMLNHPRPWDESGQLTLGLDVTTALTGITGWVLVLIIVLTSIWRDQLPFRYETWRLLHGVGAVMMAVAVTHHTLASGRYSADPLLAGFWAVLLAVALGSLVKTYLLTPLYQLSRPYEVSSVRKLALKTWELTIRPNAGEAMAFVPGQFVWLNVGNSPFSLAENPFSISSARADRNQLQFIIKEVGDMTRSLPEVKPGTRAYIDGPYGNLTLEHRQAAGIALIAGGVGIAPLVSIARQLKADQDTRPLVIVYGNRVAEQIVYQGELQDLTKQPGSQLVHVVSEPRPDWRGLTGVIDADTLGRVFGSRDVSGWLFLVCGPPVMLEVVETALKNLGVPAQQIVSERFYYD